MTRVLQLLLGCLCVLGWLAPADATASPPSRHGSVKLRFIDVPADLAGWTRGVERLTPGWSRQIARLMPPASPIGEVKVLFVERTGFVAFATGKVIVVSAPFVRRNRSDIGFLAHELVHIFQAYPSAEPAWLVEGLADYLRYYVIEPRGGGGFDIASQRFTAGYQAAAWLLRQIERRHGCGVIRRAHEALRANAYSDAFWPQATGFSIEELWRDARESAGPIGRVGGRDPSTC